jgi:hypothetical protein
LAKGKKANGIIELSGNLLGQQPDSPVLTDGTTLKSLINTIYNEGRSQLGHGGRPSLMRELPIGSDIAVMFAAPVLARYIEGLHRYSGPDTYEGFLSALPGLFPPSP